MNQVPPETNPDFDIPEGWEQVGWALKRSGPLGITYGWRLTDTKEVESVRWRPVFMPKEAS